MDTLPDDFLVQPASLYAASGSRYDQQLAVWGADVQRALLDLRASCGGGDVMRWR